MGVGAESSCVVNVGALTNFRPPYFLPNYKISQKSAPPFYIHRLGQNCTATTNLKMAPGNKSSSNAALNKKHTLEYYDDETPEPPPSNEFWLSEDNQRKIWFGLGLFREKDNSSEAASVNNPSASDQTKCPTNQSGTQGPEPTAREPEPGKLSSRSICKTRKIEIATSWQ
jgi:hypothetical protein